MRGERTLVLDNEAAQALADLRHPKHATVLAALLARSTREKNRKWSAPVCCPTVVRVEAGLDRRSPTTAALGRFRVHDIPLDTARADRAVSLRLVAGGRVVDACVAELAASIDGEVTVLTVDLTDLPALLAVAESNALVLRV